MTVVVGVDGAGRTHRLRQLLAAADGWWFAGVDGLAAARGSLVVVDDAHRLDPAVLRALVAAARSGTRLAISRRPTITGPELAELDELVAADGVEVLRPLDRDGVAALLATVTGRPVSPEAATQAHDASAGMPVVVVGTPDGLLARVQRRFAVLPREVGEVARILALRLDLPDEVLAAPLPDGDLATAMRRLREEGLLVPGGERMIPALAELVLGDLSAPERRAVHDTVARAMLTVGADPLSTAAQLRAARIRTPAAAETYLRAGERIRFTDPATALSWFDDAIDAGATPAAVAPGRAEASTLLGLPVDIESGGPETSDRPAMIAGAATAHDGRAARAADTLLTAVPIGALLAAPLLAATGRLPEAHTAAGNDPLADSTTRAVEGRDRASAAGRLTPADSPAELSIAADQGPPTTPGADPTAAGPRGGSDDNTAGVSSLALDRISVAGSGPLRRFALAAIVAAEEPRRAVPLLIEAAEDLERAAPVAVLPDTPHALGAIVAVATGDLAAAEHLLDRALARGIGGPAGAERHRLLLAWARMRAGRYDTALAELRRETELPGRERLLRAAISAGIARRRGDIAGLHAVWDAVEPVLARGAVDLWQLEAIEELLVAAARLKHRRRVEPVIATLDAIVPAAWRPHLDWLRVQVAIADGDAETVAAQSIPGVLGDVALAWATVLRGGAIEPDAVHELTERLADRQLPWEASRLAGQAALNTSDPTAARRLLERARELSEPDSATTASAAGLSERELDVARMVLAGSTHREIGAQLYISPKTVEHHVARIRGKLGATSRAELVAMLREIIS